MDQHGHRLSAQVQTRHDPAQQLLLFTYHIQQVAVRKGCMHVAQQELLVAPGAWCNDQRDRPGSVRGVFHDPRAVMGVGCKVRAYGHPERIMVGSRSKQADGLDQSLFI